MSENTIQAIHDAIQAHVTDEGDGMVTDWFLGLGSVKMSDVVDGTPNSVTSYITSENSSAHAAYGIARLATELMRSDILGDDE